MSNKLLTINIFRIFVTYTLHYGKRNNRFRNNRTKATTLKA